MKETGPAFTRQTRVMIPTVFVGDGLGDQDDGTHDRICHNRTEVAGGSTGVAYTQKQISNMVVRAVKHRSKLSPEVLGSCEGLVIMSAFILLLESPSSHVHILPLVDCKCRRRGPGLPSSHD